MDEFVKRDDFVDTEYHPYPTYTTTALKDLPENYFVAVDNGGQLTEIDNQTVQYFWKVEHSRRVALVHLHDVDVTFYCDVPMNKIGEVILAEEPDYPDLFIKEDILAMLPDVVRKFRSEIGL